MSSSPSPARFSVIVPLIVGCAQFMHQFDGTMITTALPVMAVSLNEDPLKLNLAITSYLLALAVFVPISGWMADRYGARHVFLAAIAVFTVELGAVRAFQHAGGDRALAHGARHRRRHDDAGRPPDRGQERAAARDHPRDELRHHPRRAGAADRPVGRRLHRHLFLMAVDLLPQPADRACRPGPGVPIRARSARGHGRTARPARLCPDRARARRAGASDSPRSGAGRCRRK